MRCTSATSREYGDLRDAQRRVAAAMEKPIAACSSCRRTRQTKIKTEILFIERCLELLKPGGRMGIVLPEGVFNNPSLAYVREFCEDRAFIRAVVSSAPRDVLLFRRKRQGVAPVPAKVHDRKA